MRSSLVPLALLLVTPVVAVPPPPTEKSPTTDTYHGVNVQDDYRWLENWNNDKVKAWSSSQNEYARAFLDKLPNVDAIRARVTQILSAQSPSYFALHMSEDGGTLLGLKRQPPKQQPILVAWDQPAKIFDPKADAAGSARVVLDLNVIDEKGLTSIDWYVPSPDGKLVAVSLSKAGSESGDVSIIEIATGKRVAEIIPRVNGGTAGGSLAWAPDSRGFLYTRYPRNDERAPEDMGVYQQAYFHALGTPTESDRYELGKELPKIAEIALETHYSSTPANGTILATVQKGDGGEFLFFLRSPEGKWTQIAQYEDRVVQATFGPDDALYLISRQGAPRGKLLRMPLSTPRLDQAKVIVPEGKDTLVSEFEGANNIAVTDSLVYAAYQLGGPSEIRVFGHDGESKPQPKQLPVSAVAAVTSIGKDRVLYVNTSYTEAPAYYLCDSSGATSRTSLASVSPVDFSGYQTVREMATSKDGTQIPINIISKKGTKLDGSNPCVVNGYGGFGVNTEPGFRPAYMVLLEQGFVIAIANIRGGGEFGDEWHKNGMLTKKQNCFDDFAAACKHMIDHGYTNKAKIAIEGGSNGGLLMGATLTQHPEMVRAVVSHVGIYDMLRVELSSNGAFNVTEYGTVQEKAQFAALYAYSPFHNVKDRTTYPGILFLTGANDPRVDPMQSRKMTARLQAATNGDPENAPILLRTSMDSGHGGGTPLKERIAQTVDVDSFLFKMLGVEYKPAAK